MKTPIAALLATATIAGSLAVTPASAGNGNVAAGVAAGLIGGAIVGSAIANSPPPPPYGGPAYYEPAPLPPGCYWQRQRYWDGYGWVYQPVRVCY